MNSLKIILSVVMVLSSSGVCAADAVKVVVGNEILLLPIPAGFVDPKESAPVLHSRAEQLTPSHMRLLTIYVANSDLSAASTSTMPEFKSYFMANVLRSKVAETLDLNAFAAVKSQVRGAPKVEDQKPVLAEVQQRVSSAAQSVGSQSGHPELAMKIGESRQFEIFNETGRSLSMLIVSGVEATDGTRKYTAVMAQVTSFVLLKGKVVLFTGYKKIENDADYLWLRKNCESWIQAAVAANPS